MGWKGGVRLSDQRTDGVFGRIVRLGPKNFTLANAAATEFVEQHRVVPMDDGTDFLLQVPDGAWRQSALEDAEINSHSVAGKHLYQASASAIGGDVVGNDHEVFMHGVMVSEK